MNTFIATSSTHWHRIKYQIKPQIFQDSDYYAYAAHLVDDNDVIQIHDYASLTYMKSE